MITAQATINHGQVRLEVIYPDKKQHVLQQVNDMATAQQLVNFLDRQYIILKLRSWIRQRQYALPASIDAAKLIVVLGTLDRQKGNSIYAFVATNRAAFESLAPAQASSQRPYFENFIQPILKYCQQDDAGSMILKSER